VSNLIQLAKKKKKKKKSFRNSPWDPYENLPLDYARIFDFQDFNRTVRRVMKDVSGIDPYSFVRLHVARVPLALVQQWQQKVAQST